MPFSGDSWGDLGRWFVMRGSPQQAIRKRNKNRWFRVIQSAQRGDPDGSLLQRSHNISLWNEVLSTVGKWQSNGVLSTVGKWQSNGRLSTVGKWQSGVWWQSDQVPQSLRWRLLKIGWLHVVGEANGTGMLGTTRLIEIAKGRLELWVSIRSMTAGEPDQSTGKTVPWQYQMRKTARWQYQMGKTARWQYVRDRTAQWKNTVGQDRSVEKHRGTRLPSGPASWTRPTGAPATWGRTAAW